MATDMPPLPIGVQYCRQPTPLPEEWDRDLAAIRGMGFDFIQLRPQWRWHERNEGELVFDDLDRLFDLAEKHGLLVLLKLYLPCAPDWLFQKYDAYRVRPDGTRMLPISRGAIYVGGFAPCFDRALVREKAAPFVRAVVQRYRGRKCLMAWNAWNEPRSAPAQDCACPESVSQYRRWLAGRFGTVEQLNRFTGRAFSGRGEDFSAVMPPTDYGDYAGWLLFRTWRAERIADRIAWVCREIRALDDAHPVLSHAGFVSPLQDVLEDTSNDFLNAQPFDLFGSSCPNRPDDLPSLEGAPAAHIAAPVDLICARLRGITSRYWISEIYGSRGMYLEPLSAAYLRQTAWAALAGGAKGLLFWQYRSERLSTESNDAGLVAINGEPTARSREVARVIRVVRRHADVLAAARFPKPQVALVYDFASDLISRIEAAAPGMAAVAQGARELYPYKAAIRGIHLAFWELDVPVDVVPSEDFGRIADYRAVYLPCPRMVPAEHAEVLTRFVRNGGLLICEPSPGMRDANGWAAPDVPPAPLAELFGCREALRVLTQLPRTLAIGRRRIACPAGLFLTALSPDEGGAVGTWRDGSAAIVAHTLGEGRAILLGAPLGEIYFATRQKALRQWLRGTICSAGIDIPRSPEAWQADVRCRRLVAADGGELLFLFNYRCRPASVAVRAAQAARIEDLTDLGLSFQRTQSAFQAEIPPWEVAAVRLSR